MQRTFAQHSRKVRCIKARGLRHDWYTDEAARVIGFRCSKLCSGGNKMRQFEPAAAVIFHVVRNNLHVSGRTLPDACSFSRGAQIGIINLPRFGQPGTIDDVAEAEIKVTVHALQRGDEQPLGDGWNAEGAFADAYLAGAL